MEGMFRNCTFSRNLHESTDTSGLMLNTSKVTNMSHMFEGCIDFDRNIQDWDTSNVTTMGSMFHSCRYFCQDLGNWKTGKVVDMSSMFYAVPFSEGAIIYNTTLNFNKWDTSNVENMDSMFKFEIVVVAGEDPRDGITETDFNADLSNWNTSKVTNMKEMFMNRSKFNKPIGKWDTSKVENMNSMFAGCKKFNQDISRWNTGSVTDMTNMFFGCTSFNRDLSVWDTSSVQVQPVANRQVANQMFIDRFDHFEHDKKPIFRDLPDPYKMVILHTPKGVRIGNLIFNSHPKYAVIKATQKFLYTLDALGKVTPTKDQYVELDYNNAKGDWEYLPKVYEPQVIKLNKSQQTHSLNVTATQLFPEGNYTRAIKNIGDYLGGKKRKTKRKHGRKVKTRNRVRDRT